MQGVPDRKSLERNKVLYTDDAERVLFSFVFQTPRDGERVAIFAGADESALSIALMVLRLADRGRISSFSFNRRRIGLPPSESVSSRYPS
jgi:hypothetical protein